MMNARSVLTGLVVSAAAVLASCGKGVVTYTVGGNISGAAPLTTVLITLNGTTGINMSGDGNFRFPNQLMTGDTYNVQIADPSDRCTVANGAGTVAMINIVNVSITCVIQPATQTVVRSARLSGAAENPAVMTNASGSGGAIVNSSTLAITGGVTFSGLTAVNSVGLFKAPSGMPTQTGSLLFNLTLATDGVTAVVPAGTTLTSGAYTALLANELYFEVRTAAHPNGEIRGQIQLQGGVAASVATLDQSQVVPPTTSAAAGTGTLLADRATRRILIAYITHTVTNATDAAIHTSSGPTTNGASIVAFANIEMGTGGGGTNLAYPAAGSMMTAQNLADFDASRLYFDVANVADPNSEIRGNIAPLQ